MRVFRFRTGFLLLVATFMLALIGPATADAARRRAARRRECA